MQTTLSPPTPVRNFVRTYESLLKIKNLASVAPASVPSQQQQQSAYGGDAIAKNAPTSADPRDAAFRNMYFIMLEDESILDPLKDALTKTVFPGNSNSTHKMWLSLDGEWSQPPGAFFSKGNDTVFSLLQIGLKSYASPSNSADAILVFIVDLTKFGTSPMTPARPCSSRPLTQFLQWLVQVTANQPRIFFSARNDAALLRMAFGIVFSPSTDTVLDLQLLHMFGNNGLMTVRPESYGRPPFVAYVSGMAKVVGAYRGLFWFAQLKEALKIRNNTSASASKPMTYAHFLQRPIDAETLAYTVADAGMLFVLFDEMAAPANYGTARVITDPAAIAKVAAASLKVCNMVFNPSEPKYEDNPCMPLGVFDQVDGPHRGNSTCSLCGRDVAPKQRPCLVCRHMQAKVDWSYN